MGKLHRQVGGYPGANRRMPDCCEVMYAEMGGGRSGGQRLFKAEVRHAHDPLPAAEILLGQPSFAAIGSNVREIMRGCLSG